MAPPILGDERPHVWRMGGKTKRAKGVDSAALTAAALGMFPLPAWSPTPTHARARRPLFVGGARADLRRILELSEDAGSHQAGGREPRDLCVGEAAANRP